MSRIRKLEPAHWDADLCRQFHADEATDLELGLMRMFAHRPSIAKGIVALGSGIKADMSLPPRLVELVRLRIAFHNQCRSCMAIRYREAVDAGVSEELVCSLEKPMEAPDLTAAEKVALDYGDRFATDHLSIDDNIFEQLRKHFTEQQLVELGVWVAFCVGFGRLGAVWDMTEELPSAYQEKFAGPVTPWSGDPVIVR
jgi:AhpD family alkylhydroperoxidase